MTKAYCMRCRAMTQMQGEQLVNTANGRLRLAGYCKHCGTKTSKFVAH